MHRNNNVTILKDVNTRQPPVECFFSLAPGGQVNTKDDTMLDRLLEFLKKICIHQENWVLHWVYVQHRAKAPVSVTCKQLLKAEKEPQCIPEPSVHNVVIQPLSWQ
jgi:hypothetical protein